MVFPLVPDARAFAKTNEYFREMGNRTLGGLMGRVDFGAEFGDIVVLNVKNRTAGGVEIAMMVRINYGG